MNSEKLAWKKFWATMKKSGIMLHNEHHEYAVNLKKSIEAFKASRPTVEQIDLYARTLIAAYDYFYS